MTKTALPLAFTVPPANLPRYLSLTDWWAFDWPSLLDDLESHPEVEYEAEKQWLLRESVRIGETVRFRDPTVEEAAAGVRAVPLFRRSLFPSLPEGIPLDGTEDEQGRVRPMVWEQVRDHMAGRCAAEELVPQAAE